MNKVLNTIDRTLIQNHQSNIILVEIYLNSKLQHDYLINVLKCNLVKI